MVSRADEGGGRSNKKGEEEENTSHGDDVDCDFVWIQVRACST
jgi:hypothetical protein